jgi:UPF0716 protein FxsA
MLLRLLLLFTVVPLIELIILIRIGGRIGAAPTILGVIVIGLLGAWLARREGLRTLSALRAELAAGRLPADRMIDGLLVLIAGVLMITPGLITDVAGILLLIPPLRTLVREQLKGRFRSRFTFTHIGPAGFARDDFIDVEAKVREK